MIKNQSQSGFSLIEVMISLVILTIVFGAIYQVKDATEDSLFDNDVRATLDAQTLQVVEWLTNDLNNCTDNEDSEFQLEDNVGFSARPIIGYDYDTEELQYGDLIEWTLDYTPGEEDNGIDDNNNNLIDEMTLSRSVDGEVVDIIPNVQENGFGISKDGKSIEISITLVGYVVKTGNTITKTISPVNITLKN